MSLYRHSDTVRLCQRSKHRYSDGTAENSHNNPYDDPEFPSGYRYALHYGYTDGRGTILRYDNENERAGRHDRHTPEGVEEIEFPGMMSLRDRFIDEIEGLP